MASRRPSSLRSDAPLQLDPDVFAPDPWRLIEVSPAVTQTGQSQPRDLGHRETLFSVANGWLGIRAALPDGIHVHDGGTYINGFHETWPILYPEDAVGMARIGQTMVAVPDATGIEVSVDGEQLTLGESTVTDYRRELDLRSGQLRTQLTWTTTGGNRVECVWTALVSLVDRHLAVLSVQLSAPQGQVEAVVRSTLRPPATTSNSQVLDHHDPRQATKIAGGAMHCVETGHLDGGMVSVYQTRRSGLEVCCAVRHQFTAPAEPRHHLAEDVVAVEYEVVLSDEPTTLTKYAAYHDTVEDESSTRDRCRATLDAASTLGLSALEAAQRDHLDGFWARADIAIEGSVHDQLALRWNLFALAQASTCTQGRSISAKGVTSAGYDGHYFWDTEIYIVPVLCSTQPALARPLLEFRHGLLDAARARAAEMSERGALFPWRTITGREASAFFLAGTAQYHINSAIGHALHRYWRATGDDGFFADGAAEIMVEIARFWLSLGFSDRTADQAFHIHAVTGPDEYTAMVNDNFYTNVMAQADLRFAAQSLVQLRANSPKRYEALVDELNLENTEPGRWLAAADAMYLPADDELGIYLQNDDFLERQPWPWDTTPADKYPLLLHFHPLVIYRHQVLKQPDVVMAMYLRSEDFSIDEIARNFDFYEPYTTGDSSLSSCVQAIVAAKAGRSTQAASYLNDALYLDLANTHANTADGVHLASTGGVWAAIVHGFLGVEVHADRLVVDPTTLPSDWASLSTQLTHRGQLIRFTVDDKRCVISLDDDGDTASGSTVAIACRGEHHKVTSTSPLTIEILNRD